MTGRGTTVPGRVVHVSTVHHHDDNRIFHRQCRSLARGGYQVTLIAVGERAHRADGVVIVPLPRLRRSRRMLTLVPRALALCWRHRADVYHLHDPELIPIIPLLRLRGARVVFDAHEDLPEQVLDKAYLPLRVRAPLAAAARALFLLAGWCSSRVVVASPPIASRFPPRRTTALCNYPAPPPDADQAGDRVVDYASREDTVVYAGAISAGRGAVQMVDAMTHAGLDGWKLALYGPAPPDDLLRTLRGRPGWARVDYHGLVPAVRARRAMDAARIGLVVLQPTPMYTRNLPTKLFEYMWAGLPVVASDFPVWRSVVAGAGCGILVDPTDPVAIAEALAELAADPDRSAELGERGRRVVRERFTWAGEETKLLALYHRLLRGG